ncbi:BON domain protein [Gemmata obscuriglobus]|uniref:BON domain-containing protein n=1 Tax=Gemmata obscuriglobus TaxID=114 RepID=A0A2Z3GSI4_9BACT|nr:BON domain-containing protein [Gemmata obscuriglobus]AWM36308.1 BON domain-containing protein [Gemmata obscuriglobus]QEG31081.1 BON domain protein [Gemmata obscuriglobus]VTS10418.1 : BON [Gemmata obscuriglobus UQM 2246]
MRQFASVMILVALFLLLVGSKFKASDGDKLAAVSRLTVAKLRNALPHGVNVSAPVDALRKELPTRADEAVRARLAADKRFVGVEFTVTAEGNVVTLRGVVPNANVKRLAVGVARNTVGVDEVVDELAAPVE